MSFGLALGPFLQKVVIWTPFREKDSHILGTIWHPKCQQVAKNNKQTVFKKQPRKSMLLEVTRSGPMCDPYCKYHRFREVKECPCEWLLESFWLSFGVTLGHFLQKVVIWGPKQLIKQKSPEIDEKQSRGASE